MTAPALEAAASTQDIADDLRFPPAPDDLLESLVAALGSGPLQREELVRLLAPLAPAARTLDAAAADTDQPRAIPHPRLAALRAQLRAAGGFPPVLEGDGTPVKCIDRAQFRNWGRTVENTPAYTFIPRTLVGVRNIVKWAAANGKRVRAAGYRHTWGDLYSADEQVLISLLPLDVVEDLPASEPGIDPDNELQGIRVTGRVMDDGVDKALCRIGAATTNEQFRRWCLSPKGGNCEWTIPLNVIMVEITWGGSNAPICHGAGWHNRTLSDLVTSIEFVNARGELQAVDDPALLKAAAGCFGLLGVVTAITLRLDPMTVASMRPERREALLTIPPPAGFAVPLPLQIPTTPQQREAAWTDFVSRCEQDYYAEWFWFAYQPDCWINTWKNDGDRAHAVDYPSPDAAWLQGRAEYCAQLLNEWPPFQALPGKKQGQVIGALAMAALPDVGPGAPPITTWLIDALHFQRGIQNMRVRDMELEIPIPPRADDPDKPDWSVCQRAWWNAIAAVYRREDGPMRIALEMRVMGGSDIDLAPQRGNRFGTCSIEVLSTPNVSDADWTSFLQEIADAWMAEKGPDGGLLNVRTHWAKEWQQLNFNGWPAVQFQREVAYREAIPGFAARLRTIAQAGGSDLGDLQRLFSNPLLDEVFRDVFAA